jgi:hypothetical protein
VKHPRYTLYLLIYTEMNHKMRSIATKKHKTSTTLVAIASLTAVLLSTVAIESGHVALAYNIKFTRVFSNSGNNQETQQECGNSCTVTSSNAITSGSSGLTTPSPSPSPTPTVLTLSILGGVMSGTLRTDTGSRIPAATITFTGQLGLSNMSIPLTENGKSDGTPVTARTDINGNYQTFVFAYDRMVLLEFSPITAHYAGAAASAGFAASNSQSTRPIG